MYEQQKHTHYLIIQILQTQAIDIPNNSLIAIAVEIDNLIDYVTQCITMGQVNKSTIKTERFIAITKREAKQAKRNEYQK